VRDRLRAAPVTLPDGEVITLDAFTDIVSGLLYSPATLQPLAEFLRDLYSNAATKQTFTSLGRYDVRPDRPGYVITGAQPVSAPLQSRFTS